MISILSVLPLLVVPAPPAPAVWTMPQRAGAPAQPAPAPARNLAGAQDPVPEGQLRAVQIMGNELILNFSEDVVEGGLTLQAFVKICQETTGINFYTNDETARLLEASKVRMFGTKRIQKEDFYSFFQIIMIINKFVCTQIGPDHQAVVVVQSLDTTARGTARQDAQYVLPEDLPSFADQPATLIQTVIDLPNTDVRTLSNSMRSMVVDPNTLQIIPVGNTNSLIIQGFGSNVVALVRMLQLVDEASKPKDPIRPVFELITLEFSAAEEVSDTIESLLDASRRAVQVGRAQGQTQGATAPIPQGEVETKIMVDQRTNSLLVMAMPDDLPRIRELVARLDVDTIERERTYHFYSLENVDARELAEVLTDFLQDASRVQPTAGAAPQQGRPAASGRSSTSEIAIVADPATNSLLIAAGRSRFDEVFDLIRRMDKRQDQVLIETALIELSGRDFLDIGVELGGASLPGPDSTGQFGVTNFGLSDFLDNDGDGIPDTRVPRQAAGITAGILDGDNFNLPLLIAAMSEKRDTNVLNIPSVLVNNNGNAVVKTLDEQPTAQVTGVGSPGVAPTQSFGEYQEAGITLQISPTISASRYLRLNISLEVSSFQGTVQGVIPPPRLTRIIQTVVSVPDGDTMVIGGIILDNTTDIAIGVPFLSKIPVLGHLFKRTTNTNDRTSLYFFVTPHIMHDREFADLSAYSYKKKLEAADSIGAGRVRMIDGRFGREGRGVDFEGFNVPLYQSPPRGAVEEADIGMDPGRMNSLLTAAEPVGPPDQHGQHD